MVFQNEMAIWMGKLEVRIIHAGAGHTEKNLLANTSRTRPKIRRFPIYEHCIPFDVSRAYARLYTMTMRPKASNIRVSGIWTTERDQGMCEEIDD